MQITFTRTGERTCKTVAIRDDRVVVQVPSFDRPAWLPHDMAHYVVELNLKLYDGFWGRVAEGALYKGMVVLEGRQSPHASDRSQQIIKRVSEADTEVEVLVDIIVKITQQNLDTDWAAAQAQLRYAGKSNSTVRPTFKAEEIRHVCGQLREMQRQWTALENDQSITVTWPRASSKQKGKIRS